MKKLIVLGLLTLLPLAIMAAAPASNNWAGTIGDTLTVDSQYTADQWELLDSIIVIKTDTCHTIYTMSGSVSLNYGAKLYLGFDDGGGAAGLPTDTFIIENIEQRGINPVTIPFSVRYLDSLIGQTDANDTIYFYAAIAGSSPQEKVVIEHGALTAIVYDRNAAGIIGE